MLHRWSRSFYRFTVFLGLFGIIALLSCSGRQTSQETAPNTTFVQANTQFDDGFGYSIALSTDGGTLAVGASGESSLATGINGNQTDNSAESAGAVYLFTHSSAGQAQQAYVKASNTKPYDFFGQAIALSADGGTLAVGAPGESSLATGIDGNQSDNSVPGAGAVYVFTRSNTGWSQIAYVKASNPGSRDGFGLSVALSADGSTLAVGAPGENSVATGIDGNQTDNSAESAGAVYLFTRSGTGWLQQAYVKPSNTESHDFFGRSVALSADGATLVVGAPGESSSSTGIGGDQTNNLAPGAGAIYLFARSSTGWSQQAYVKPSNTGGSDGFGQSVALSIDGATIAVGAPGESSLATGIGGNQADNSAPGAGAVYLFSHSNAGWSQQVYVKASNTEPYDFFGRSLALSADGTILTVGAIGESSIGGNQRDNSADSAGAVYLFARSNAGWSQQAYVKPSNPGGSDGFGQSVALSADGSTLTVGAMGESSLAVGINGNQIDDSGPGTGAAYLFSRNSSEWSQQAYVKPSNTGGSDGFGQAVALGGAGLVGKTPSSSVSRKEVDSSEKFVALAKEIRPSTRRRIST
jgi:FG-GAP repeat